MLGVVGGEAVEQQRRVEHRLPRALVAGVERAHRVQIDPLDHVPGEPVLVRAQERGQLLAILGAGLRRTEAGEAQPDAASTERVQQVRQQQDQLGVGLGPGRTDRLGTDLPELPVATLLRRLGAEVAATGTRA